MYVAPPYYRSMAAAAHREGGGSGAPPAKASVPLAVRRHPIIREVSRRLADHCGVSGGGRIVIGVSGGPDSVGLLLAVAAVGARRGSQEPALEPVAAHVNHHLRRSADADQEFVSKLCDRLGVAAHIRDVWPDREPGNLAANARRLRYDALADVARTVGARWVAVAHHAEDQLETLLIALCRGAGLGGLGGMPFSRPLDGERMLIRPLLGVPKSSLCALCRAAEVGWREDPTNEDPSTLRGKLRRDVLPALAEIWPHAAMRGAAAAEVLDMARGLLQRHLEEVFGDPALSCWPRAQLRKLPVMLLAAGLRRAAGEFAKDAADALVRAHLEPVAEAIRDDDLRPREFQWPGGLVVVVRSRTVELVKGGSGFGVRGSGQSLPNPEP